MHRKDSPCIERMPIYTDDGPCMEVISILYRNWSSYRRIFIYFFLLFVMILSFLKALVYSAISYTPRGSKHCEYSGGHTL